MALCVISMDKNFPEHLKINGRKKIPSTEYNRLDKLFRGFCEDDLEESGNIGVESIGFPDL